MVLFQSFIVIIYDNFMDFSIQFDTQVPSGRAAVAGFGVFDGVHPGHRLIIREAAALAAERNALTAAVTFVPHPRQVISGAEEPGLIISVAERVKQLRLAGADITGIIDFTPGFAALEPEVFLEQLLKISEIRLAGICVGEDWRFGRKGMGDAAMLERFCRERDLLFRAVPRLYCGSVNISSSMIRQLAGKGDLAGAAEILGRPLTLTGKVVHGFQAAGKELAAPTANLELDHGLIVPDGVYAGAVRRQGKLHAAVLNIGMAPTYNVYVRRVEVHLLNFKADLYGENLEVRLLKYLRGERKFPSVEMLREQIHKDIAETESLYKSLTISEGDFK